MTRITVDGETLPICPVCDRAQPLEGGTLRLHEVAPVSGALCPGSKRSLLAAAAVRAEKDGSL